MNKMLRKVSMVLALVFASVIVVSCSKKSSVPVIGIAQPVEDVTLDKARKGFEDALAKNGYSEKDGTVKLLYKNAQNEIPTLNQIMDYFISEKVTAIAANATLPMQVASAKTSEIPIFIMVAPAPRLIDLKDQANLSGVYDTLTYIDKNLIVIREVFPSATRIGVTYNSSEPNSMNAMKRLRNLAMEEKFTLVERAVTNSNEVQQAVEGVLAEGIEIFFALPDNTVFAAFENILKLTYEKQIPIVTSEVGLVKRGASLASGPDIYLWGYEAGEMAAEYLKGDRKSVPKIRAVSEKNRKKMFNAKMTKALNIMVPPTYEEVESDIDPSKIK